MEHHGLDLEWLAQACAAMDQRGLEYEAVWGVSPSLSTVLEGLRAAPALLAPAPQAAPALQAAPAIQAAPAPQPAAARRVAPTIAKPEPEPAPRVKLERGAAVTRAAQAAATLAAFAASDATAPAHSAPEYTALVWQRVARLASELALALQQARGLVPVAVVPGTAAPSSGAPPRSTVFSTGGHATDAVEVSSGSERD